MTTSPNPLIPALLKAIDMARGSSDQREAYREVVRAALDLLSEYERRIAAQDRTIISLRDQIRTLVTGERKITPARGGERRQHERALDRCYG